MQGRELSETHIRTLERLVASGFEVVSFPLFPACIGVRQDDCVALLEPQPAGGFGIIGQPTWLVSGQLSAKVERAGGVYFVWKSQQVAATPTRLARLKEFEGRLRPALERTAPRD